MINFTEYKSRKELELFCEGLFLQVAALKKHSQSLNEQLEHSETLLKASNIPSIGAEACPTERLILRELKRLDDSSKLTALETEEIKNLKMLVESLVTLRKKEPLKEVKPIKKKIDPQELLSIVNDK